MLSDFVTCTTILYIWSRRYILECNGKLKSSYMYSSHVGELLIFREKVLNLRLKSGWAVETTMYMFMLNDF